MGTLFKKFKVPVVIIGILVISFIIFKIFFSGSSSTSSDVLTADTSNVEVGKVFVDQLRQLKNINLDSRIFVDAEFGSLTDFNQPLPDVPVGRANPFSPVSGVDASANYADSSGTLQFNSTPASSSTSVTSPSSTTSKANTSSAK